LSLKRQKGGKSYETEEIVMGAFAVGGNDSHIIAYGGICG
jgi:hypothetical protein